MTRTFSTVLVANRGEIAVRVIRAAADAGLRSVAVYAEPDVDAPFVRMADEAFALGGATPGETYLSIEAVLQAARRSGADAVHPGYGFLSENADFADAVLAAGMTWIGPSPEAMRALGDKVTARHIAEAVGAPLVPGTADPVAGVQEVVAFAAEHGLPVAIKAAFGGGGRGMKVARTEQEVPELYDSAVREAVAAFGRGECFVERYLDRPRHVEAQVVADEHGHVVVVGTRDCSLQRRYQKLVEEAPAPFLTTEQRERIHAAATDICRHAGYTGAGTVEFLVAQDGFISFLEVNTRLQVEHPVSEETSGLDLVLAQFAVARGESLADLHLQPRGHSIEFRITCEDPGRDFLPSQGTITRYELPTGPGVRVDSGVELGTVVGPAFDSLLAKLVVTGADRPQALARARRALAELRIDGVPTVIGFHRAVVDDAAFVGGAGGFAVHTRWIETEWAGGVEPWSGAEDGAGGPAVAEGAAGGGAAGSTAAPRQLVLEVDGRRLAVSVVHDDGLLAGSPSGATGPGVAAPAVSGREQRRRDRLRRHGGAAPGPAGAPGAPAASTPPGAAQPSAGAVTAPLGGVVTRVAVSGGQHVEPGDLVAVVEAMKMENAVTATCAGTVGDDVAAVGSTVSAGDVLAVVHP